MRERLARVVLLLSAVVFAAFGAAAVAATRQMAEAVGIGLTTDVARTDFMATYGGFELGFGLFLGLAWRRGEWVRPGLIANGCALAGFASMRLLGIVTSTELSPLMLAVFVVEATGCALSFWAAGSGPLRAPAAVRRQGAPV
jgi:hypothetical protein